MDESPPAPSGCRREIAPALMVLAPQLQEVWRRRENAWASSEGRRRTECHPERFLMSTTPADHPLLILITFHPVVLPLKRPPLSLSTFPSRRLSR